MGHARAKHNAQAKQKPDQNETPTGDCRGFEDVVAGARFELATFGL